ncbi:iron transporter [Anoxybacter fermentans]|uniref:Iron transporter n=1 Tax=Anoxybacter fermentans TaxID=1323375 RepID=A0A3S9SYY4_9FIRM|nr:FeoA family protein [Anoxybacter fermentans]AZR73527.1 iron transporter [Anoxybacter fermentans]
MTLAQVERGAKVKIKNIPDDFIRAQAIRFGISEGAEVECIEKIPGGPVIVRKRFQEIAIGRRLAENIIVSYWNREVEDDALS